MPPQMAENAVAGAHSSSQQKSAEPASPKNEHLDLNDEQNEAGPSTLDTMENVPKSSTVSSFGLHRYYSRVLLAPDRCLLPDEMLKKSPSRLDNVDEELERELRYLGCELIQSASILLRMPQVAAATAQILFQRYFYVKSFVKNDYEHVAMACTLLASKIEETPRRPRDVINALHHLKELSKCKTRPNRKPQAMIVDLNYTTLKNQVIKAERRVLNVLGFCVHAKHPHKLITLYAKALECTENIALIQRAWNYMNDGLRTDIFMHYSPETIACACLFLSARFEKVPLPMSPQPWWALFDSEQGDIIEISLVLLRMYNRKTAPSWSRIDRAIGSLRDAYQADVAAKQKAASDEVARLSREKLAAAKAQVEAQTERYRVGGGVAHNGSNTAASPTRRRRDRSDSDSEREYYRRQRGRQDRNGIDERNRRRRDVTSPPPPAIMAARSTGGKHHVDRAAQLGIVRVASGAKLALLDHNDRTTSPSYDKESRRRSEKRSRKDRSRSRGSSGGEQRDRKQKRLKSSTREREVLQVLTSSGGKGGSQRGRDNRSPVHAGEEVRTRRDKR